MDSTADIPLSCRQAHFNAYAVQIRLALRFLSMDHSLEEFKERVDGLFKKVSFGKNCSREDALSYLQSNLAKDLFRILCENASIDNPERNILTCSVSHLGTIQHKLELRFGRDFNGPRAKVWVKCCLCLLKQLFDYDSFRAGCRFVECNDFGKMWWGGAMRDWSGAQFVQAMWQKVRYCLYCNADTVYAMNIQGGKRRLPYASALDHFLPRRYYPYFGLSLYNLVPACTRCNSALKHDQYIRIDDVAHPYRDDVYGAFRFRAQIGERLADVLRFYPPHDEWLPHFEKLCVLRNYVRTRKLVEDVLHLYDVYESLFKPELLEILRVLKFVTPSVIESCRGRFNTMNIDPYYLVLGCSLGREAVLKSRLAKLKHDMLKQFRGRGCAASS